MTPYRALVLVLFMVLCLACTMTAPPGSWANPSTETPSPFVFEAIPVLVSSPTPSPAHTPAPTPSPTQAVCKVHTGIERGTLNLRQCASLDCEPIAWLEEGSELHPLPTEQIGQWLPVRAGTLTGWVYAQFTTCGGKP